MKSPETATFIATSCEDFCTAVLGTRVLTSWLVRLVTPNYIFTLWLVEIFQGFLDRLRCVAWAVAKEGSERRGGGLEEGLEGKGRRLWGRQGYGQICSINFLKHTIQSRIISSRLLKDAQKCSKWPLAHAIQGWLFVTVTKNVILYTFHNSFFYFSNT